MKKKLLALSALTVITSQANAFRFDTNEDWNIRWDNTVKLNIISRLNEIEDQVVDRNGAYWLADDATLSQDRSSLGLVSTRFDVLSELDVIWKNDFGFRVSGSGWYDPQYEEGENDHPSDRNFTWASPSADVGDYNHEAEDLHYAGGELLDAFVFGNFDIGETAIGFRAGRHTIYWGNSLLGTGALVSIGNAMAPLDFAKALSVPGSEAKELFMPTNKISTVMQFTDNLTFNAYYSLEHGRNRYPETGTFFSPVEGLTEDTEFITFPPLPRGTYSSPQRIGYRQRNDQTESEAWGVNFQYYIEPWDLEASFIYLNYVDPGINTVLAATDFGQFSAVQAAAGSEFFQGLLNSWNATCNGVPELGIDPYNCPNAPFTMGDDGTAVVTGQARWLFKEDNDLWGISLAKEIAGISFGLDMVYRPDTPVSIDLGQALTRFMNTPDSPLFPSCEELAAAIGFLGCVEGDFNSYDSDNWLGVTGDVWTLIFNGVGLLQENGIWEGGSYIFEITQQYLDKCTENCQLLDTDIKEDRVVTTLAGIFRPTWYQVWPGTDLTVPVSFSYTPDGDQSPITSGGDEERGNASIGAEFLIDQKWTVRAQYNAFFGPVNAGLGGSLKDRDNLSFTVKRTF